jgi:two-component system, OmpR family, phosphate regulon sensor histidine kinase PhoR
VVNEEQEYERLRAAFTAVVSHELRTPLARLLALLETAALPGEDPHAHLERARGEVEQMRELVDDVLFLSELETGREVVSLGNTRILPIVDAVLRDIADSAERAGVELSVDVPVDAVLPLRPRMLRVVVENLVGNSIRYSGPNTSCLVSGRDGLLKVVDDGAGVDEAEIPRLFERFFRADRARASRGTGLGLAIVKHIVTAAGGTVEASGGPGRGLTISCRFAAG